MTTQNTTPVVLPVKRPRGRPKDSTSGPRPRVFVCVNFEDKIAEKIYSPKGLSKDEAENFSKDDAKNIFFQKHNKNPDVIIGKFQDSKDTPKQKSEDLEEEETAVFCVQDIPGLSDSLGIGIYDNWKGNVYKIEGNNQIALFIAKTDINDSKNRNKPSAKAIDIANIVFC